MGSNPAQGKLSFKHLFLKYDYLGCALSGFLSYSLSLSLSLYIYILKIIPQARLGYESIAHEAEAERGIDSEAMRARGIIVLVKSN